MTSKNFRDIIDPAEIDKILFFLREEKININLWQKWKTYRSLGQARISNFIKHQNIIEFVPATTDSFRFDHKKELYFHSNHRSIIFKSTIRFNSNLLTAVKYPEGIMGLEERKNERQNFWGIEHYVCLENVFNNKKIGKIKRKLIDKSPRGFSIEISKFEYPKFYQGDQFKVEEREGGLIKKYTSEIIYIKPRYSNLGKTYRIGMQIKYS